jgi:hypothetical protein
MRKLFILLLVLAAVVYFVPSLRQGVINGVAGTLAEWTKPDAGPVKGIEPVKVYVLREGRYYHQKGCPQLAGATPVVMSLQEAREMYKPCPDCNPPR